MTVVLSELLEDRNFLMRLAEPSQNEIRELFSAAFSEAFEKIASGRVAGIVNNKSSIKVLETVTLFLKYTFLRSHIVANSGLRIKFVSAFAAIVARTDEIINELAGKSANTLKHKVYRH